ncbi:MAG TPA: alpha/beta hydrolase [Polyangia bacterium]
MAGAPVTRALVVVALVVVALVAATGCAPVPRRGLSFRELAYPVPTRQLDVDGIDIAYSDSGHGERTLLLIHGLNSYIPEWQATLPALAAHHRVVAIDLPGYGRSSKRNYVYSMELFARVVERVIERLGLGHVTLVGHSMGGQIALTHALLYPGVAESLVLVAPAGFETFTPGERAFLLETLDKNVVRLAPPEAIWAGLGSTVAGDIPKEAEFFYRDRVQIVGGPDFDGFCYAVVRSMAAMARAPVFDRLPSIRVPVLVIFGTDDRLIPNALLHGGSTRAIAEAGVRRLPHARLVMVPGAGHFVNLERPDVVNREVLDFVGH